MRNRGQFLYPEHEQKQTFFDPPPHLVHVVIECPLSRKPCKQRSDLVLNGQMRVPK